MMRTIVKSGGGAPARRLYPRSVTTRTADLSHRTVRTVRAVLASSVATLVALVSHLAAGGPVPPLLLVAAVCVLAWLPAVLLIGRRSSPIRQAVVIALSEGLLHVTFTLGAAAPPPGAVLGADAVTVSMPGMGTPTVAEAMPPMSTSPAMWLAHAVAAALTMIAWSRGEAAFWTIVRLAHRLALAVLPALLPAPFAAPPASTCSRPEGSPSFHLRRVLSAHARRGPPPLVLQF